MATTETTARSEMTAAHNLYRRAQRSSKSDCNARCVKFLRKAKRKPVLHMTLFFLLITISVVVILIVVLTTWPELEKEFSETNTTRYGYEDTVLFRIPTREAEDGEKNQSIVSTEMKNDSTEFYDSLPEESNSKHESIDLDIENADFNLTSIEQSRNDSEVWHENEVTFNASDESGGVYYWDISPSLSSSQTLYTDNFSSRPESNSDQEEENISFFSGPDLTIDDNMFTYTKKETTTQKTSHIYTHPSTQLSALLTLRKNSDIKPSTINPVTLNFTQDLIPTFSLLETISSTELNTETPLAIAKSLKEEFSSSSTINNNIITSSSIDSQVEEHNFWSSLANLSLAKFPFMMHSEHDLHIDETTSLPVRTTLTTSASYAETVHVDDDSDYSIRYVIQISSTQNATSTPINGTISEVLTTKDVTSALSPSEAEYNHWPTSEEDMTLSETPSLTNDNVLKEMTASSLLTKIQGSKEADSIPSEVEFFPSTETEIPTMQITPTIENKFINSSIDSGWEFDNGNINVTQEQISDENSLQTIVNLHPVTSKLSDKVSECRQRTLSFCDDVSSYNLTYLPNLAGATTEFEKWQLISYYNSVLDWGCNLWIKEYLCYILEPMCVDEVAVPPCNSLCRAAKKGCEKFIAGSPNLEAVFRCDVFPSASAQVLCAGLGNGEACKHNEYRCSDTTCIPGTWWCDGVMDCEQGDDEKNCHPGNRKFL